MNPADTVMALWVLFGLSWIAAAAWARRPSVRMAGGPQAPLYAAGSVALLVWAVLAASWPAMHVRLWPELGAGDWMLVALAVLGFGLCWWARVHLGHFWSAGVDRKEGHRVVDTGPYAWVRHPIYTGAHLALIAFALVRARPAAIGLATILVVFFSLKARLEERFLRQELGRAYDDYRSRVGRLVPGLGRVPVPSGDPDAPLRRPGRASDPPSSG